VPERAKAPPRTETAPPPRQPWPAFAEVSAWPALNAAAFRSRGHLVRPGFVDVRISAPAREAYLELVTDTVLPEGTTVALFFTDESRQQRGPVFVMEKNGSSWRYFGADRDGLIDPAFDPQRCANCHEGATADGVFGLPRGTEAAPAAPAAGG